MCRNIAIIGGGPGGYVAAIKAAQLGARVTLIEKDRAGGTCLNRGCIPTKALYKNAEVLNTLKNIKEFGIEVDHYSINIEEMHNRKQKIIDQLVSGVEQLLKANKVEVINGAAEFKNRNTITVTLKDGSKEDISADNFIIAAGSEPMKISVPGTELEGVYVSEDILNFDRIPEKLVIIGGGVIGMEFAGIFNAMGSKVTVVEFLPSILAKVDSDIVKRFTVFQKKKGIDILTNTRVIEIEKAEDCLIVKTQGKKGEVALCGDAVLMAAGRIPSVDNLGLEKIGIEYDKKGIKVDCNYETNIQGIYAIGDINGLSMLAHAASYQGEKAAERIVKHKQSSVEEKYEDVIIPGCIFSFPEISFAGITEDEAKARGIKYKTSKFMFGANGKALTLGEPEGFVKVIASEDNVLIGVHIMGPHASDIIHEGVLAIGNKMHVEDISRVIHAHPTLPEAFKEAVMGITGNAVHMLPKIKKL